MDADTKRIADRLLRALDGEASQKALTSLGMVMAFYLSEADDPEVALQRLNDIFLTAVPGKRPLLIQAN